MLNLASQQRCGHSLLYILHAGLPRLLGSIKVWSTSGLGFFSVLHAGQAEQKSLAESWDLRAASQVKKLIIAMF